MFPEKLKGQRRVYVSSVVWMQQDEYEACVGYAESLGMRTAVDTNATLVQRLMTMRGRLVLQAVREWARTEEGRAFLSLMTVVKEERPDGSQ